MIYYVMAIRLVDADDIPRVAEIHIFGWRCAYRGIISDDILFNKRSVAECITRWHEERVYNKESETYVYDDGIVKAFLTIGRSRDKDKPNAFELWGIYVDPSFKRQGIGKQLVTFCENKAKERGFKEIILHVLEKNKNSRKFYEKMGYKTDGMRVFLDEINAFEIRYVKPQK